MSLPKYLAPISGVAFTGLTSGVIYQSVKLSRFEDQTAKVRKLEEDLATLKSKTGAHVTQVWENFDALENYVNKLADTVKRDLRKVCEAAVGCVVSRV